MCFIPMEIVLNYSDMLICLPQKIVKFLTVILKFFIFIMVRKSIS